MSYQVLARKWRPHDFDSMVGQDAVVAALRHALDENRLHHAYLFTGTRVGLKVPEKTASLKPKAAAPAANPAAPAPAVPPHVAEPAEDIPPVAEPDLSAMPPWEDEGGEPRAG